MNKIISIGNSLGTLMTCNPTTLQEVQIVNDIDLQFKKLQPKIWNISTLEYKLDESVSTYIQFISGNRLVVLY